MLVMAVQYIILCFNYEMKCKFVVIYLIAFSKGPSTRFSFCPVQQTPFLL